MTEFKAHS